MEANKIIADYARKGAAIGEPAGAMCGSCAFRLNSAANLEPAAVDAALESLAYYGTFNCHTWDEAGKLADTGRTCAGFTYAKQYFESLAEKE